MSNSDAKFIGYAVIFGIIIVVRIIRFIAKSNATSSRNPSSPQKGNPFQQSNFNQLPGKTQQQNSANQKPNYQNTFTSAENFNPMGNNPQPVSTSVYCMYCGKKFPNLKLLSMDTCFKHPNSEAGLQKHVLYRGVGRPNIGF